MEATEEIIESDFKAFRTDVNALFKRFKIDTSDVDFLFSYILGVSRPKLNMVKGITRAQVRVMRSYAARRVAGEPVQQITGFTEFCGFKILVNKNVLIPRLDTEVLVDVARKQLSHQNAQSRVLDLCTGSGAIAIALSKLTNSTMTAADISRAALACAQKNAERNNAEVEFIKSDMFDKLAGREFDIIICNPPYISASDYVGLDKSVREFEPKLALTDDADGLTFYKILASKSIEHLAPSGQLVLEVGVGQAKAVVKLLGKNFENIEVVPDLCKIPRVIVATVKDVGNINSK